MKSVRLCILICLLLFVTFSAVFSNSDTSDQTVSFNFADVELTSLVRLISNITGKNFIYDERLKGRVTVIAQSKLSINEAYKLFISVIELKGYTIVPSGKAYRIIPISTAKQVGAKVYTDSMSMVNEAYVVRLVRLKHVPARQAYNFIKPLIPRDRHIAFLGPDILLIVDSVSNIEKVLEIIEQVDRKGIENPEIIFLKYADAEYVAGTISELIARRFNAKIGKAAIHDTRLNAVLVFGDKAKKDIVKQMILMLDVPSPETAGKINVYFLQYADAADVADTLQGIIKSSAKKSSDTVKITISPHKSTNSLVIDASLSDFQDITKVIRQLDKKQRQVYVEAMIVEASVDRLSEIGLKWRTTLKHKDEPVLIGGFGKVDRGELINVVEGLSGLTVGGMRNFFSIPMSRTAADGTVTTEYLNMPGFAALLNLSEFKGVVNILSTPQILTADNKESEIIVGENVPFVSSRESDPARPQSMFTSIERKDVGIKLKITPHITEGDFVRLDVYQEMSSVKSEPTELVVSIGPTLTKRSTRTSVSLKNGQTVVIGGLMQERKESGLRRVPFLSSIPLIGELFKYRQKGIGRTNLLVFLTPHIIRDTADMVSVTEQKKQTFAEKSERYVQGEVFVQFKKSVDTRVIEAILELENTEIIGVYNETYHLKLPKRRKVDKAVKKFQAYKEVELAKPNYRFDAK